MGIINLPNLDQSVVQSYVNNSIDGDVLILPEGNVEWTSKLVVDSKNITLKGAGKYKTRILSNMPNEIIRMNYNASRITDMELIQNNENGVFTLLYGCRDWRIDHCKITNLTDPSIIISVMNNENSPFPRGLIDHNVFDNARIVVYGGALMANTEWSRTLGLGTYNAVYVENNYIKRLHGNCIDANYGGRYVFRNNIVVGAYIECHAVQMTNRAGRSWEIYNNELRQNSDPLATPIWTPFYMRGGTGVIYNNTLIDSYNQDTITVDNRRSCSALGDGGQCDGTSTWDGNEVGMQGYLCRDQIGSSTDAFYWDWINNPTNIPSQEKDPMYVWNNKYLPENRVLTIYRHNCAMNEIHIQSDRDYFEEVKRPMYIPYQYPHPEINELQGSKKEFKIHNYLEYDLVLTESPFKIFRSGDVADFTIEENELTQTIANGEESSFFIRFAPLTVGQKTMTITIPNNDPVNNPYVITVTGNGIESQEINIKIDGETILHSGVYDFGDVAV